MFSFKNIAFNRGIRLEKDSFPGIRRGGYSNQKQVFDSTVPIKNY